MLKSVKYDACFLCLDRLGSNARTLNMARTLVKHGKKVAALCIGSNEDADFFAAEGIDLYPVKRTDYKKLWMRWSKFAYNAQKHFSEVGARTFWAGDLYSLHTAVQLTKKYRSRLYYDSREIYSALGPLAENPLKQKILSYIEMNLIGAVDEIIVSGPLDEEYLKEYFATEIPFNVIMNLPPYKEKTNHDLIRKIYEIPESSKILIYQGMLLDGRGIMPAIEALQFLEGFYLFIAGEGPSESKILEKAKFMNVSDRVILHGQVPYDDLHDWTCSADLGLALTRPISFSYKMALPNKFFEYCMAHIPTLISDLPASNPIVKERGIGKIVAAGSTARSVAEAIKEIFAPENYENYVKSCRKASKDLCYEAREDLIVGLAEK